MLNCENKRFGGRCTVTDTVHDVIPRADVDSGPAVTLPCAVRQDLPSERLVRLAELTAARLTESANDGGSAGPQVPEQALAEVLAAVDASTAMNTK